MADDAVTGVQAPEYVRERVVIPSLVRAARYGELPPIARAGMSAQACRGR
ncbi:hypothetical protein [Streptomyces sp. NPDC055134]